MSSDQHPPITDERAREFYVYAYAWDMGDTPSPGQERAREVQAREWDTWIASHDNRVKREAAQEVIDELRESGCDYDYIVWWFEKKYEERDNGY